MPYQVDPREPIPKELEGITFLLRVFTQREVMRFKFLSLGIVQKMKGATRVGADAFDVAMGEEEIEKLEKCLSLGIVGWEETDLLPPFRASGAGHMAEELFDELPADLWFPLYTEIIVANGVTEADEKN